MEPEYLDEGAYNTVKRMICFLVIAVMAMAVVSSLADPVVVDGVSDRNITITKAGDNEVAEGVSPTTGRTLSEIEVPEEFLGMAKTGEYMPVTVQITNAESGTGYRAPWYASYADVVYESPLERDGVTRLTMVFNDTLPDWIGCTRSIRIQHVWIREEWNGPFVYWGHQSDDSKQNDVEAEIVALGHRNPQISKDEKPSLFYDGVYDQKPWGKYRFRVNGYKEPNNGVFYLKGIMEDIVANEAITPNNHAYLFSDTLPEGGDDASTVYVSFNTKHASADGYYFNSMLQYEPDDGVYYRWIVRDPSNTDNSVLYEEMAPTNVRKVSSDNGQAVAVDSNHGNPISFSNVIVQHVQMSWIGGDRRMPHPTVTGSGNADIFVGGKHYSGVWNRDTMQDRTVFYGEDGQEFPMQKGKTLIIMLDSENELRELRYE